MQYILYMRRYPSHCLALHLQMFYGVIPFPRDDTENRKHTKPVVKVLVTDLWHRPSPTPVTPCPAPESRVHANTPMLRSRHGAFFFSCYFLKKITSHKSPESCQRPLVKTCLYEHYCCSYRVLVGLPFGYLSSYLTICKIIFYGWFWLKPQSAYRRNRHCFVLFFPVVLVHKTDNILWLDVYLSAKPKGKEQTNKRVVKNSTESLWCFQGWCRAKTTHCWPPYLALACSIMEFDIRMSRQVLPAPKANF